MTLNSYIESITSFDRNIYEQSKEYWDKLTHPVGSLGEIETATIKLAAIQGQVVPKIDKKAIIVMCGDNGICDEDVCSSPQVFTQLLANAMVNSDTGVCALAKSVDSDVFVVDVGMKHEIDLDERIIDCNIRESTNNFLIEDAMTREEAIGAIEAGIAVTEEKIKAGYNLFGTGELGIANTTTSSALLYALSDLPVEQCVGLGAGINEVQLQRKIAVVKEGVESRINKDDDVISILAKVGGFDIAGLVGVFLACAKNQVAVVVDGVISSVAALIAAKLNSNVMDYIFSSHLSKEKAASKVMNELGLIPYFHLNMRLGEGSGCPFTFFLLEAGISCMNNMSDVENSVINQFVQVNIRDGESK